MHYTHLNYTRPVLSRAERRDTQQGAYIRIIVFALCCILSFIAGVVAHNCFCEPKVAEGAVVQVSVIKEYTAPAISIKPVLDIPSEATLEVLSSPQYEESEAEPEAEFKSFYEYTEEELDLLARLIEAEVGAESYEAKLRVGSVVMNRVMADAYFPDTIREVIYQKNQFAVTTTRINGVLMIDRPADEDSIRAAREILDYGSILPHDVQVFYAVGCTEKWVTSRLVYEVCDKTVFAYIFSKGAN